MLMLGGMPRRCVMLSLRNVSPAGLRQSRKHRQRLCFGWNWRRPMSFWKPWRKQ
ncbi:protein MOR1-like [Iris pallida]|uniref:Protein MOR1-like n=1 Tax=Iris pallida TaxID=29817 RepID=A0AAX6EKU0_IRIPA|nr:protein MOR1-like [Iris pallida]